ncbi:MAG: hypothetical protein IKF83_01205 [Clostridia bacterium]|nr:hypothetical protein [Clostridia bacterium]
MLKNSKGITLIALVVTIIVLLILAGVTIAMLAGQNGILGNATKTKEANAEAQAREQANLAYMAVRTEIAAKKVKDGNYKPSKDSAHLQTIVESDLTSAQGWTIESAADSTTDDGTGSIKFYFTNNALNTTGHKLSYEITLTKSTATMDHTTTANPAEGYRQIQ